MPIELRLEYIWIPEEFGGHCRNPYDGMRLTIRWQKHIEDHLKCSRDVVCRDIYFDEKSRFGATRCTFPSDIPVSSTWLEPGELIELLNGFRVVAVGKIV